MVSGVGFGAIELGALGRYPLLGYVGINRYVFLVARMY